MRGSKPWKRQVGPGNDPLIAGATIFEACPVFCALPPEIKPIAPSMRLFGPARTVLLPAADNLWLHRALCAAFPSEVLVAATKGGEEAGYWGEIMTAAAQHRSLGGLVIDGCVRDSAAIAKARFPVFARGLYVGGTSKLGTGGGFDVPITIGKVRIRSGDLIVGDADGVVAIPRESIAETLAAAAERTGRERQMLRRIRRGELSLDVLGLPR